MKALKMAFFQILLVYLLSLKPDEYSCDNEEADVAVLR